MSSVGDHQSEGLREGADPQSAGDPALARLAGPYRRGTGTAHQAFQLSQIPLVALFIATGEREQKHPLVSGRGDDALGIGFIRCEDAKIPQVALFKRSPAIGLRGVRNQEFGRASSIGRRAWCKAQPVPRGDVEGDHGVAGI